MIDWRESHHWLRGYSDALIGRERKPIDSDYNGPYDRGYLVGLRRRGESELRAA